ncbi:Protein CBG27607 [Caenorhabditis briggsae]|uniref:Protein CBG27607 n=1 Tax=Caenorhabditis briggsae TaxID=6238 RepID=B6IKH7_CAEBR|nr:Protein CBG27607 [Caenorhabditis briggsae]CAS00407.1 Protein CBG27607 [Caenorhabditis briggsae]
MEKAFSGGEEGVLAFPAEKRETCYEICYGGQYLLKRTTVFFIQTGKEHRERKKEDENEKSERSNMKENEKVINNPCVCQEDYLKEFHPLSCQNLPSENVETLFSLVIVIGASERVFRSVDLHCPSDQERPEERVLHNGSMNMEFRTNGNNFFIFLLSHFFTRFSFLFYSRFC